MQTGQTIKGLVGKTTKHRVNGWAFLKDSDAQPVLDLFINGEKRQTCKADIFRESLKKIHPVGNCGFSFAIKKSEALSSKDNIQVFCGQYELPQKNKSAFNNYYFFIHIPKTAGSSFRYMLYNEFKQDVIYPNVKDIQENNGRYPSHEMVLDMVDNKPRDFQFLMGHYPFHTGKILPKRPKYLVFLRNPVQRAISNLYHLKRHNEQFAKVPLLEIIEQANWQINNIQVRFMADKVFKPGQSYLKNTVRGDKALAKAKKNLDKCDFVGLTEYFEESVEIFQKMFDWKIGRTLKKNVAPKKHKKISEDLYNRILTLNQLDIELYEHAKKRYSVLHKKYNATVSIP